MLTRFWEELFFSVCLMKQRGHADWTRIPTTRHSLIVSPNWPCPSEVSVQGNMKINNKNQTWYKVIQISSWSCCRPGPAPDELPPVFTIQYNSLYYYCNTGIVRIVRGKKSVMDVNCCSVGFTLSHGVLVISIFLVVVIDIGRSGAANGGQNLLLMRQNLIWELCWFKSKQEWLWVWPFVCLCVCVWLWLCVYTRAGKHTAGLYI